MANQTKGFCKFCGKEYTKNGMLRHLAACKNRKERLEAENEKKKCGYFDLVISGKYNSDYWLVIEMQETATLKDLDQFIRDIWVECCGHLSAFTIGGTRYESCPGGNYFWGPPARSMDCKLKDAFSQNQKIEYEYDFGSTTELLIKVQDYRVGTWKKDEVTILSRNNPPEILCDHCRKNKAKWINPEGFYGGNAFWCEECLEEENSDEEDEFYFDEFLLPVCNSPRMGVCGYEGSNIYPDQFEPDEVKIENILKDNQTERENILEECNPIEQWRKLYEAATRIKELQPWEKFWDLDLIGIRDGAEEDTVFYSILGRGGDCFGIVVYEGYEGLNKFMMITMQEYLNLPVEYVMHSQKNLTCYWGNREELSQEQRGIIKELGYKYRGKNQWLYFMSFEPGYYPYNLNPDEVVRMTKYFQNLEIALQYYDKLKEPVDFGNGNMFYFEFGQDKKTWNFGSRPLPFTSFQFGELIITDDELLSDLAKAPKCDVVLEADISALGGSVKDKKYKRPANPAMCMIGEAVSGMILKCELLEPEDDVIASLAEEIIGFIFECGAPKEIRVSNILVEAGLEQICEVCGIKLRRVKQLEAIEDFKRGMKQFI